MIPKKIHYCWFGGNPKPEIIEKCIASWHHFCPDWEIIEWNEENYDVNAISYMAEAYAAKKWAFVSDVARLDIVAKHGGVYLDTDVELLTPIEELLDSGAFYIFETERNIATGLGFGAEADHPTVRAMLGYYNGRSFLKKGKPDMTPCPANNTEMLLSVCTSMIRNGRRQQVDDVLILSPQDYSRCMKHYGTASWTDNPNLDPEKLVRHYKDTRLKRFLRQPQRFELVEKHFGKKAVKLYTFCVYDLMEMGLGFYLKKLYKKVLRK